MGDPVPSACAALEVALPFNAYLIEINHLLGGSMAPKYVWQLLLVEKLH